MGNGATKKEKQSPYLLQSCEDHESSINCMALSDDASVLATGSDDATIRLWSTKTETVECIGLLEGHTDYVTCIVIDENFVLSSSADKTIRKWELASCECILIMRGHESTINKFLVAGDCIFSISYDKKARMWDFDTGECLRQFAGHTSNITSLLFIPCADLEDVKRNLMKNHTSKLPPLNNLKHHNQANSAHNDKDLIVTGSLDMTAKSWSVETTECLKTFKGHTGPITCMATDPFGKFLFTGSADHDIRSWEISTGKLLTIMTAHSSTVLSLFAHKKLLYSSGADHTARCWVMEFGECTRSYKDHGHSVSIVFEHKGQLFTGCGDGVARCFDTKSGTLKRQFAGHTGAVNCLKIVDNRLYTGSFDGTLKIWNAELLSDKSQRGSSAVFSHRQSGSSLTTSETKMSIENEKSLNSSRSSSGFTHHSRTNDSRSEIESNYEDHNQYYQRARRIDVKEIV